MAKMVRTGMHYNRGVPKVSAGLVMFRRGAQGLQVLLVHPGGPYFQNRDEGIWTIPKGELDGDEDPLAAAQREFAEETGLQPCGPFLPLGSIRQKAGKVVHAWAFEGDCDPASLASNEFDLEWPPKSGRTARFPEVDRAEFFSVQQARQKINPAQMPLVETLQGMLAQTAG